MSRFVSREIPGIIHSRQQFQLIVQLIECAKTCCTCTQKHTCIKIENVLYMHSKTHVHSITVLTQHKCAKLVRKIVTHALDAHSSFTHVHSSFTHVHTYKYMQVHTSFTHIHTSFTHVHSTSQEKCEFSHNTQKHIQVPHTYIQRPTGRGRSPQM